MNQIKIRFAQLKDLKNVRRFDPHSEHIDKEKIRNKIEQKEIIVAEDNHEIAGLIKFSYFWQTRPYLDLIFINPKLGFKIMGELTDINFPHNTTAEIFFSKKISEIQSLKKYPIL